MQSVTAFTAAMYKYLTSREFLPGLLHLIKKKKLIQHQEMW